MGAPWTTDNPSQGSGVPPDPTKSSLIFYDNLHILLWLLKDTCWLMDWKIAGVFMVVPTVGVAVYLAIKTIRRNSFFVNLAILFWITANSYWMICEFVGKDALKIYALAPFILGLTSIAIFYISKARSRT